MLSHYRTCLKDGTYTEQQLLAIIADPKQKQKAVDADWVRDTLRQHRGTCARIENSVFVEVLTEPTHAPSESPDEPVPAKRKYTRRGPA